MLYIQPEDVIAPQGVLEFIELIHKEHNEDYSYSLAKVKWAGEEHLAMRWNISRNEYEDTRKQNGEVICKGMPISTGHPVWFILPKDLTDRKSKLWGILDELSKKEEK